MATITPEKRNTSDGKTVTKYVVRWRDPAGKQRERTFTKKSDADMFATKVEHQKNVGTYSDPNAGRVTFATYAEGWLAKKRATRKASTVASYEIHMRAHIRPTFGSKTLASVQRSDVQAWVNAKSAVLAPSTLRIVYSHVASIFRDAVLDRLIPFSPCNRIALPAKIATKVSPLTTVQVYALADAINSRYRALVIVGAGTGLRRSELMGLTVDRIDFLRRTLTVDRQLAADGTHIAPDGMPVFTTPKTAASNRTVPLPQFVIDVLAAHLAEYGEGPGRLVFTNTGRGARGAATSTGRVMGKSAFYGSWASAIAKVNAKADKENPDLPEGAKLPTIPAHTTCHDLRHTYASLLIEQNENPKVIQVRLGHANIAETLDTYGHLFPSSEDSTRVALDAAFIRPPAPSQHQVSTTTENRQ